MWNTPAADRVAALREQAVLYEEPTADLSDLELLNKAYESVLREQIDTRDRYMGLLTSLRAHDEAVRAAAVRAFKENADRYARQAVNEHMRPFQALLYRVEQLPDRPGPRQMDGLRSAADQVRFELKKAGRPEDLIDPGGARHTLRALPHVVAVLDAREGLDASDVLGWVKAALDDEAPTDLFTVTARGTSAPAPPAPPFAEKGWNDLGGPWAYQPDDSDAHVKAYPVGEDWYVDLWSGQGQLLAFGTMPATEVATLAPALITRADAWTHDRSEYAWRRFADTAQAARTAPGPNRTRPARHRAGRLRTTPGSVQPPRRRPPARPNLPRPALSCPRRRPSQLCPEPPATAVDRSRTPYPSPHRNTKEPECLPPHGTPSDLEHPTRRRCPLALVPPRCVCCHSARACSRPACSSWPPRDT